MSREAVTGWGTGTDKAPLTLLLPGSEFPFLKYNCFLLKTSLKVLIGWLMGYHLPKGENQTLSIIFHFPNPADWEQASLTSVSAWLMRHVIRTNPSAALMGNVPGTRAGGWTSVLHLYSLNKHVRVCGEQDHWETAPSDDALPQAMKRECYHFRGDCQRE